MITMTVTFTGDRWSPTIHYDNDHDHEEDYDHDNHYQDNVHGGDIDRGSDHNYWLWSRLTHNGEHNHESDCTFKCLEWWLIYVAFHLQ